jgi:hypothetical protein
MDSPDCFVPGGGTPDLSDAATPETHPRNREPGAAKRCVFQKIPLTHFAKGGVTLDLEVIYTVVRFE